MVSEKEINKLVNRNGSDLVTITLPTHKAGEESKQDPIRLKNLLTEAVSILKENGKKESDAEKYLKSAFDLLDKPLFWAHADKGLAIYISEDESDIFKLPYKVDSEVYVHDHHLITPLLPMLSMDGTFCVLAVSRQEAKLLKCTRDDVEDITPADVSVSVADYLEVDQEKQLQFHTGSTSQQAMYFGHGASEEDKKVIVEQFLREFEKEVTKVMRERNDPLVIMGLKDNLSIYKKVNNYGRLVEDSIEFNPDGLSVQEIRDKGWSVIQKHFLKDMYSSLDKFSEQADGKVSNNLGDIVEATIQGRSQTIFISKDEKKWGVFDESEQTVHYSSKPKNGDIELLNWLSITGRKKGTNVYMLPKDDMPMRSTVAAEFRF
jgi:exonuclease III